jgi:anti-sigma regulatory factor (Ser/Thr protein kinase)
VILTLEQPFFVRAFRSPVDPDRLRTVRESIVTHVIERGLPKERAWDMAAAADELLTNIDEHAGAAWIEISLEDAGELTLLRINDDGRPFDVGAAIASISAPNNHRERGMGLYVVKSMAQSVQHRRLEDGANETLLSF